MGKEEKINKANNIENNKKMKFMYPRFKENNTEIHFGKNKTVDNTVIKAKNITKDRINFELIKAKRQKIKENIKRLFLNDLKFCFNKGYYSKEFTIYGKG